MSIKTNVDLAAAFAGREVKEAPQTGEVPERIRNSAPEPVLRPGGGWAARADAVDQKVREAQDAAQARREWAGRATPRHRSSMRMSFRRSSNEDEKGDAET